MKHPPPLNDESEQLIEDTSGSIISRAVFPAQYKYLDDVRQFVAKDAQSCGLDDAAVYAVKLAVDEAFTNIVEHAYGGECSEDIECSCQINDESLVVTLQDCGDTFNPENVADPDLTSSVQEREVGGLGFFLIHKLMDEVKYKIITNSEGQEECTVLTMVKHKG